MEQIEAEVQVLETRKLSASLGAIEPEALVGVLERFKADFEGLPFAACRGIVVSFLDSIQVG